MSTKLVNPEESFVVAVDPGGTTGVAWVIGPRRWFGSTVCAGGRFGFFNWFTVQIGTGLMPTAVVCEDFIITDATARKTPQPDPYRIIGWLELWCYQHDVPFCLQSPAKGKGFGTDAKLKHLGWHSTGNGGHDVDAARHLLTFLAQHNDEDVLAALKDFS